jgi:hypothetical protein
MGQFFPIQGNSAPKPYGNRKIKEKQSKKPSIMKFDKVLAWNLHYI